MNRRHLLAALGSAGLAGFGGCAATDESDTPTPPTSEPTTPTTTTPSPTPDPESVQRRLALASQDAIAAEHYVAVEAELVDPVVTDDDTAGLRITTTNSGPERALSVGTDGCDVFDRTLGQSSPEGLWLYRADATDSIDRRGDRWEPDISEDQPRGFGGYGCPATAYESGESVTTAYEVWDDYRLAGYFEPGTYRWEAPVRIWDDPAAETTDPPTSTVRWGVTVQVSEPGEE